MVCDRDRARAEAEARAFEVGTVATEVRELVESAAVDVVDVVTDDDSHLAIVMAALEAGKHVLSEKPVAHDHRERAPQPLRQQLVSPIPLGEPGRPSDVADAVLFLCSARARHITGAVLDVDGGSLAGQFSLHPG